MKRSAFPFKDPQTDYLHRSVVTTIQRLDYEFQLPNLNEKSWSTICDNASERERLEFVGDALIGAFIAEELYRRRPDGGPGYYTVRITTRLARLVLTLEVLHSGSKDGPYGQFYFCPLDAQNWLTP